MKLIIPSNPYWQAKCWEAAEKGSPFYMVHLTADVIEFLRALEQEFPYPTAWSENQKAFFFNLPLSHPTNAGTPAVALHG